MVSIEDDTFVARLVDLTADMSHESEEATISLDELSDADATNMAVGSIFRWVIGYERSPEATRKRVSQIVFRDLPRMTEGDLQAGREWARKIAPALNPARRQKGNSNSRFLARATARASSCMSAMAGGSLSIPALIVMEDQEPCGTWKASASTRVGTLD